MINADVTVESHVDEAKEAMDGAIAQALTLIGMQAVNYAKLELKRPKPHADGSIRPNVDTGRLVNSITNIVKDDAAYVGTNVEYAAYVELGTHKSRPYPYLVPAARDHAKEYGEIIEEYLRNA